MAKFNSVFKLDGTFQGMTVVRSRAYGDHVRAARGTKTRATLNPAFVASGKELVAANEYAGMVKGAIDLYRHDFQGGMMWQRLVSIFKQQYKETGSFGLGALNGFEVHKDQPLERYYHASVSVEADTEGQKIAVRFLHNQHPHFHKKAYLNFYRFRLIGLFPDVVTRNVLTSETSSAITDLQDKRTIKTLETAIPAEHAGQYILLLKLEGVEIMPDKNYRTQVMGMRVLQGGRLG